MECKDLINLLAILLSPVIAVVVTLWYQSRTENRNIKKNIFFALMKNRNSLYIPVEYVEALNSIDYVFQDSEKIKNLWASLYDNYNSKNPDTQQRARLQIDLLSAIASHLGYQNLTQMQINKYYTPQLHADEVTRTNEVLTELLRVLKSSESFGGIHLKKDK
jgi:hypothetical protein